MNSMDFAYPEDRYQDSFQDDDLVITGISGRFPMADNMEEFKENLLSKKSCFTPADDRWPSDFPNCGGNNLGVMKSVDKFDAEFFNMNFNSSIVEDPQTRILSEVCHEAIVDAGYSPKELNNRNCGVFTGQSDTEPMIIARHQNISVTAKSSVGHMTCMESNKLSYRYNATGPSFCVDAAWSSSATALEDAFRRLKDGSLECAIVAGTSTCFDPRRNREYLDLGLVSPTGEISPYDEKANGFVRGEAIIVVLIQKKKNARRIYAKIHNVECIAFDHEPGETFVPSLKSQLCLYRRAYENAGVDPATVAYIEGHGISTQKGDEVEVNGINEIFCKDRKTPLLLGSVTGNIGNTQASSGLCSIAKVILAFQTGMIPPNINYKSPNKRCPSLSNGNIEVVTEMTPYDQSLVGINSFSYGGSIAHMILERYGVSEVSDDQKIQEGIPKLVVYAATTKEALIYMFENLHQNSMPREFFALLNKSAYIPPLLAPYRGFTVMQKDLPAITSIEHVTPVKREVWYVVTGMGCQWAGMGLDLMQLDVFAQSIRRSAEVLKPFGIDLFELLNPNKDHLLKDRCITPAFVTIVAIQIALVDVLNALGLEPDGIIGHSTGEIVCAYADGCATAEQTILSAYYRGASVEDTELPLGQMAAVGLSWEETKRRCPDGVFPACHNAEDSVTISGSAEAVQKFVEELRSEGIFARVVNAYGYAFHCKTISAVTEKLRSFLQEVYEDPKPRSKRWLSTSYCEPEWSEPGCQFADASYFCHNLESEVHFMEVLKHIPADAITIEIGPHFLLQSILKRAIGNKASYIGLMKRNDNNNDFLLSSIGKLYTLGLDPLIENLYEPVSFPVPRGTPMISPLIQWNHSISYPPLLYQSLDGGKVTVTVETSSADGFLLDHCIEGRSLYPATGYMYLAWTALAKKLGISMYALPVCIENFKIMRPTILNMKRDTTFEIGILGKSGDFELQEGGSIVATGKISTPRNPMFQKKNYTYDTGKSTVVSGAEMYNELKIHGYEYGPAFQGLLEINMEGTGGLVKWNGEWISFLDSLLLFFGIIYDNSDFRLPTGALSVKIDPMMHAEFVDGMQEKGLKGIPVQYDCFSGQCCAPGVEIRNLKLDPAPHRSLSEIVPVLEEYSFVPYFEEDAIGKEEMVLRDAYMLQCCHLGRQITNNLNINGKLQKCLQDPKFNNHAEVQEYCITTEEHCHVLKTLRDTLEMSISPKRGPKIAELCENISDILAEDMLFKAILEERPLRSLLEVAAENSLGTVKITEWRDNSPLLLTVIQDIVKSATQTKTIYTLIHSQTSSVDGDDLSQRNIVVEHTAGDNSIPDKFIGSCHLGVASFMLGNRHSLVSTIQKLSSITKEEGFMLVIHKHELTPPELLIHLLSKTPLTTQTEADMEEVIEQENLLIVSKKSVPFGVNAYLLRKKTLPKVEALQVHIVKVDDEVDQWVEDLKKAIATIQEKDSSNMVYLVAQGSMANGIIGMVNCLKQELGGDRIRCIFTDGTAPPFDLNEGFYTDALQKNLLMNVYMDGCWGSFRHTSLQRIAPQQEVDYAYVACTKLGDLSSFKWMETPMQYISSHGDDADLYHVYYSSINFRDVMVATGKLSVGALKESGSGAGLGVEFSGRDFNGNRIMAMTNCGTFCNTFIGKPVSVFAVPENWSLEEAATVPVVYSTCYYALIIRGQLEHGEKILIHSGTGGIGQAAIRIALSMDCEIFTTVGSAEKRNFLLKTFPEIKPENIGCSRDTTFEEMIMRETNGEGVDVVLNSLAEDKLQASVRCLAHHGRFLEIGKYDLHLNNTLGLDVFLKGISFHGIQLDTCFKTDQKSGSVLQVLQELLCDGIRKGVVQPLNTTVFTSDEVEKAFRYMGSGKHTGKVLLKIREEEPEKTVIPPPVRVNAFKTFALSKKKSYIIIGGLGGFGIELAKWLVCKGAGTVVLTSRYGVRTPYHHLCLKRWEESGSRVVVSTLNVAKRDDARKLLEETAEMYGPIGGIFNSAVVLKDSFIENQTAENFKEVCAPKALATKYLDELTREMCPELDMFVCFSSISCGKGNAGQTNYGYANSVMERICEQRKRDRLHGLAIQWGIIGDVGLVHRHMGDDAMIAGVMAQKVKSCIDCLEKFLLLDKPVVSSFVVVDKSRVKNKSVDILAQMAKLFGVSDIDQVNPYRTFAEMGIDSMAGVEMKQLLEVQLDTTFTLQQIQGMKIDDVRRLMAEHEKNKDASAFLKPEIKSINFSVSDIFLPPNPVTPLNIGNTGTPIFIVNGNDFLNTKLQKLCEHLTRPAFAVQSTKDMPVSSVEDMARWYLEQIEKQFSSDPIYLASVSTASSLVLEMALQAQKLNCPEIKRLIILDGCLSVMEAHTTAEEKSVKSTGLHEASDLCEFLPVFSDSDLTELRTQLELLPSMESKVNLVSGVLTIPDKSAFVEATELYMKKQNALRSHVLTGKVQTDLTIIEAAEKVLANDVVAVKSFMSQICSGKITIHRVPGNNAFFTSDSSATEVAKLLHEL